jgi:hypothetical protein
LRAAAGGALLRGDSPSGDQFVNFLRPVHVVIFVLLLGANVREPGQKHLIVTFEIVLEKALSQGGINVPKFDEMGCSDRFLLGFRNDTVAFQHFRHP